MSTQSEVSDSDTSDPSQNVPKPAESPEPNETSFLLNTTPNGYDTDTSTSAQETAIEAKYTILGMIAVAAGTGFINTGGCLVAVIGGSVLEIMLVRWIVQGILGALWWYFKTPPQNTHFYGDRGSRINIWSRGALYFLLCFGWYRGLELVPIGDAEAIIFIAPLLIVLVARFWLKEPLSKVFPGTFILTIAGIIFVCQPEFIFHGVDGAEPVSIVGLIFLIIMAISWTGTSILVRTAQEAHWTQIQMVSAFQGAFIWTPLMILFNQLVFGGNDLLSGGQWIANPDGKYIGLVISVAVCGFLGITLNVIGYQLGDASKVAWMEYLDLIFAFIFQYAVFGDVPNIWEWIGLTCLMSTCMLHLGEEVWKYRSAKNDAAEALAGPLKGKVVAMTEAGDERAEEKTTL